MAIASDIERNRPGLKRGAQICRDGRRMKCNLLAFSGGLEKGCVRKLTMTVAACQNA
jgi:hypothetical protein